MDARQVRQVAMLDVIEALAMGDLGLLDDPETDDLEWTGVYSGRFEDLIEEYQLFMNHGILPGPGGYRDQHVFWRRDMKLIRACYNVFYTRHKDDRKNRHG